MRLRFLRRETLIMGTFSPLRRLPRGSRLVLCRSGRLVRGLRGRGCGLRGRMGSMWRRWGLLRRWIGLLGWC